jgi:hypothetical protein
MLTQRWLLTRITRLLQPSTFWPSTPKRRSIKTALDDEFPHPTHARMWKHRACSAPTWETLESKRSYQRVRPT